MKSNPTITAGLFTCLVLIIIYGYLIVSRVTKPVDTTAVAVQTINSQFLDSPIFKQLSQKDKNGTLPVTVTASEVGNPNPFE
jgi:hypothetical protein